MSAGEGLVIDGAAIETAIAAGTRHDAVRVRDILDRARSLAGLAAADVAALAGVSDPELLGEIFSAARAVKDRIYGARLVLFAPLYVSNLCANDCSYCAFRSVNTDVARRALTMDEIARETAALVDSGHKRVLLVAGEAYPGRGIRYVLDAIETIYAVKRGAGEIRRINVNVAPLSVEEFAQLKAARIGTYQIFQETYHEPTYARVHRAGPKRDYRWRIEAIDRAMQAGIDDCGVGILFGLFDWRWELLALMQHIAHLETRHGCGPHTVSVPRLEPATGADDALHPPFPVSDLDFRKIVAILRLAVPYTGIIMSTRETPNIRRETFALGVSQISAGSRTNPGGYAEGETSCEQFQLGDHRSLDEVVRDIAALGYVPSFCTACYRLGRTGADFMDLAKPGDIRLHCEPNGLATFTEYLLDYASRETRAVGDALVDARIASLDGAERKQAERLVARVRGGGRDVLV